MTKPTAVLFCPGRGSYTKDELGFVGRTIRPGPVSDALAACNDWRRSQERPTLSEIDGAEKFRPGLHLEGENAAELIYFGTMAQLEQSIYCLLKRFCTDRLMPPIPVWYRTWASVRV